jgi:hypothetical protein
MANKTVTGASTGAINGSGTYTEADVFAAAAASAMGGQAWGNGTYTICRDGNNVYGLASNANINTMLFGDGYWTEVADRYMRGSAGSPDGAMIGYGAYGDTITVADEATGSNPTVTISATDANAAEPSDTGTFRIYRGTVTTGVLAVTFTPSGTASSSDYSAIGTVATITAGATSVDITITPVNDTAFEDPETIILTITAGTGYDLGATTVGTVTITSDEVPSPDLSGTPICKPPQRGRQQRIQRMRRNH